MPDRADPRLRRSGNPSWQAGQASACSSASVFPPPAIRGEAGPLLEGPVEAGEVLEAALERDGDDAAIGLLEELPGVADAEVGQVVGPGRAGDLPEELGEASAAHVEPPGHAVQGGRLEE